MYVVSHTMSLYGTRCKGTRLIYVHFIPRRLYLFCRCLLYFAKVAVSMGVRKMGGESGYNEKQVLLQSKGRNLPPGIVSRRLGGSNQARLGANEVREGPKLQKAELS